MEKLINSKDERKLMRKKMQGSSAWLERSAHDRVVGGSNPLLAIFSILILGLFFINLVNSSQIDYPTQKINMQFSFCQPCSDATYITLLSILTPNETININENMTEISQGEFCYNYTPSLKGDYDFRGISDGCENTFAVRVPVSQYGDEINQSKASIYILILIINFILLATFIFGAIKVKWGNEEQTNSRGEKIIKEVSKTKYLKIMFSWFSYGLYLIFITTITGLVRGYITFDPLISMVSNIYRFSIVLGYGFTIFIIWFTFLNLWKDIILNKKILKDGEALISGKW